MKTNVLLSLTLLVLATAQVSAGDKLVKIPTHNLEHGTFHVLPKLDYHEAFKLRTDR